MEKAMKAGKDSMSSQHYRRLILMILLSFVAMYCLMYAMVNVFANVYPSLNQLYMAGLMTAPMAIVEIVVMGAMYGNKKLNAVLVAGFALAGVAFWLAIRQQAAISDRQFLKSMIPHHAGAILMCQQASLQDPALKELCTSIISSQQSEIDLMKAKLQTTGD
ncbi:MAG: DUF305 domain-containing protein [Acidobacteriota bacterium]